MKKRLKYIDNIIVHQQGSLAPCSIVTNNELIKILL
jgi:hypothetical protein